MRSDAPRAGNSERRTTMRAMRRLGRAIFETPTGTFVWTTAGSFVVIAAFSACIGKRVDLAVIMFWLILGSLHTALYLRREHTRRQRALEGQRLTAELPWNKGTTPDTPES